MVLVSLFKCNNLVNSSGVVAADTTGVGTGRWNLQLHMVEIKHSLLMVGQLVISVKNLVSNSGVVAADVQVLVLLEVL